MTETEEYRLPTEAEWEYACRAGTQTAYSFGDDAGKLGDYAWWGGIEGAGNAQTEQYAHTVGLKNPNAWGLLDMHGNLWEWCGGWYGNNLRGGWDPVRRPVDSDRVYRGGGWNSTAGFCRSANRDGPSPGYRSSSLGFRVARSSVR